MLKVFTAASEATFFISQTQNYRALFEKVSHHRWTQFFGIFIFFHPGFRRSSVAQQMAKNVSGHPENTIF